MSFAVDLGLGQPIEHLARSCLIASRLAKRMALPAEQRSSLFYLPLLGCVGCIADSRDAARWFGDDIAYRADVYDLDMKPLPFLGYLLRRAGQDGSAVKRVGLGAALLATGARGVEESLRTHCKVTAQVAARLGMSPSFCDQLTYLFARWDGKGIPKGVAGEQIPLLVRLWHVSDVAEVHHRLGGAAAATEVVTQRRGTQFAPDVVDTFVAHADELFGDMAEAPILDELILGDPSLRPELSNSELDDALSVVADYVDLKSPQFSGHSRAVADLADGAARIVGLSGDQRRLVRRAASAHAIGRLGVSNAIWDKPGPLTQAEKERARMHTYYTERVLSGPTVLAEIGALAALTHERLDGSGYHRGLTGSSLGMPARVLAAADVYQGLLEPRAQRDPLGRPAAAAELQSRARDGALDSTAVDAVLTASGGRPAGPVGPAGLTPRELEVLALLARGSTNRQIARQLSISPKTVGNHVERIYAKADVNCRASAILFAMQHGLLSLPD